MQNFFNAWPARSWLAPGKSLCLADRSDRLAALLRMAPVFMLAAFLAACGGGGGGGDPAPVPVAPSITAQPASLSVQAGQTATFSVAAAGDAPLAYQWLRNSNAVAGAVQSSYTFASPTMADTDSRFAVRVSNAAGTVTSAEAVLTVTSTGTPGTPGGISMVVPTLGYAHDLAIDAQGNTFAAIGISPFGSESAGLAVVARKFAPDGSELPYGPEGQGLPLPGSAPNINAFGPRYTGAALATSGDIYVSTVTLRGIFINSFAADGGRLSKVAPDGQVTVIADWPAGSPGAVAPTSVTLGPDGSLFFVDLLSGHLMKRTSAGVIASVGDVQARPGFFFGDSRYVWIAVESADRAYVINRYSFPSGNLLKRVEGGVVTVVAGNSTGGSGVDGIGTAASFGAPTGLSVGRDGILYVADGTRLRKVTPEGVVTTVAGQVGSNVLTTGPLPGSLGTLGSMAIRPDGVIHVMTHPPGGGSLVRVRLD